MLIRPCFCLENVPKAEPKSKHRKLPYSVGFGMPHSPGPTGVGRASKERRSPPARQQTQTPTCCCAAARKGEIKFLRRAIIKNLGDRASFPLRRLVPRVLSPAPYQVSRPAARPLGPLGPNTTQPRSSTPTPRVRGRAWCGRPREALRAVLSARGPKVGKKGDECG
jgi:hypothetical protein